MAMAWAIWTLTPASAISLDDVSLRFLPAETQGIAFIDLAALRNAPLAQDAFKAWSGGYPREITDFMAATGFDPMKDLDSLTVAKIGARDGLAIAQGRMDRVRLEQFFKDKGKAPEAYLGQTLYHDRDATFGVLEKVVLIGQPDAVKKGIDQMQLPGSAPLKQDLMDAIQTIESGNQVWAVGEFSPQDIGGIGVAAATPAAEVLQSLKGGTYQMRIDTGLHARATGRFINEETARNMSDLARGGLALSKLQVSGPQPSVLRLLDGIEVNSSGPTVVITIEESGDLLKQLQELQRGNPAIR
jgi:hypothetical protein